MRCPRLGGHLFCCKGADQPCLLSLDHYAWDAEHQFRAHFSCYKSGAPLSKQQLNFNKQQY
jgi:hypothetical protein